MLTVVWSALSRHMTRKALYKVHLPFTICVMWNGSLVLRPCCLISAISRPKTTVFIKKKNCESPVHLTWPYLTHSRQLSRQVADKYNRNPLSGAAIINLKFTWTFMKICLPWKTPIVSPHHSNSFIRKVCQAHLSCDDLKVWFNCWLELGPTFYPAISFSFRVYLILLISNAHP